MAGTDLSRRHEPRLFQYQREMKYVGWPLTRDEVRKRPFEVGIEIRMAGLAFK
jgi:hypothetical protein